MRHTVTARQAAGDRPLVDLQLELLCGCICMMCANFQAKALAAASEAAGSGGRAAAGSAAVLELPPLGGKLRCSDDHAARFVLHI